MHPAKKDRVSLPPGGVKQAELPEEKVAPVKGTYKGDKNGEKKHGKGVFEYDNGDSYDGIWANDKRHGTTGSYTFASGELYSGAWSEGYAHGRGVYVFNKGDQEEYPYDLWYRGACLRLVPSAAFQLGDDHHEDDKAFKKSSVSNMLDDWRQIIGNEIMPQSGVLTANVLREWLLGEADSKQWLTWLYFCTKWEKALYGPISVFLAFPDPSRSTYLSLTQVITSSGLLEKLVMKFISSPTPATPASQSPASSEASETEIQKLFALCLDIDEDETVIQQIIKVLKSTRDFVKPLLPTLPPYFSHALAHTLSAFKKLNSSSLHFLNLKIASLEKKVLASLPPHKSTQKYTTLEMLKLLSQLYREKAKFQIFDHLEAAPKVRVKILGTSSVLQGFVERKIGAMEKEDPLFIEDMEAIRSQAQMKDFEEDENNSSKFLEMYVAEKSAIFKAFAEDHKRDVQMMEQVTKSCEELYLSVYKKAGITSINSFNNLRVICEKITSEASLSADKELLAECEVLARFALRQVDEIRRIVSFEAPYAELLELLDDYTKSLNKSAETNKEPTPAPATPTSLPNTPSYFKMALSYTKGLFRNVTQYSLADDGASQMNKAEVYSFQPINIFAFEKDQQLLKTVMRDHSSSEIMAHILAESLRYIAVATKDVSKSIIAEAIVGLQDGQYSELRAACLTLLNSRYGQDDEHRKEFVANFVNVLAGVLDFAIKEPVPVGSSLCELLVNLTLGPNEVKVAVARLGIKKIIDLMDAGARIPQGEPVVHGAAQVLANLSAKEEYLVEISSKGGLARMLEVAKLGKLRVSANIPESEINFGEILGTGTFAEVKRAEWDNKQVAVKIFREAAFTFRLEDFWKEVTIMSLLKHDNLLRLLGASIAPRKENSTFMLITEFMKKGTLRDIIRSVGPFPAPLIVKYGLEVARGLAYMHNLDVLHRDIKASNILVTENDVAKVGDLGLSRVSNSLNMTQLTGTPKWEAPECLTSSQYSKSADVYSYGVVLCEMVTGEEPFPEITEMAELKKQVCDHKARPKLPKKAPNCPEYLSSLITACWSHDPKKRPTFDQIIEKLSSPNPQ